MCYQKVRDQVLIASIPSLGDAILSGDRFEKIGMGKGCSHTPYIVIMATSAIHAMNSAW